MIKSDVTSKAMNDGLSRTIKAPLLCWVVVVRVVDIVDIVDCEVWELVLVGAVTVVEFPSWQGAETSPVIELLHANGYFSLQAFTQFCPSHDEAFALPS